MYNLLKRARYFMSETSDNPFTKRLLDSKCTVLLERGAFHSKYADFILLTITLTVMSLS